MLKSPVVSTMRWRDKDSFPRAGVHHPRTISHQNQAKTSSAEQVRPRLRVAAAGTIHVTKKGACDASRKNDSIEFERQ